MGTRCEKCGHLNKETNTYCEVCNNNLCFDARGEIPHDTSNSETNERSASTEQTIHGRYPLFNDYKAPQGISRNITQVPKEKQISLSEPPPLSYSESLKPINKHKSSRKSPPNKIEGTIISIENLNEEPPKVNVPRILASIIIVLDFVLFLGSLAFVALIIIIAIALVATILQLGCLMTVFSSLIQSIFYFLLPLLRPIIGRRGDQRLEPVTNYLLRTSNGQTYTFRIKGQLQGATIARGDRVHIEGRLRHGILMFRRGHKINTGEKLTLPFNWAWVLLGLVILGNVIVYFTLYKNISGIP